MKIELNVRKPKLSTRRDPLKYFEDKELRKPAAESSSACSRGSNRADNANKSE